ncbi:hypothetical protein [Paenibacillus sp. Soil787]|uniref:hypothetical protein n=1 Tax=Paenibacillus sp. Soil787 TaxID=1736411 RepID=UPI00190FC838|nr:hypothetical protein [Paenibacillus sp. Soil787]
MSAPTQTTPMAAGGEDFSLKAILPPLMAIIVGMIMVILDSTVVNNAIPKLVARPPCGAASGRHRHVPRADRLLHAGVRRKRRRYQLVQCFDDHGLERRRHCAHPLHFRGTGTEAAAAGAESV